MNNQFVIDTNVLVFADTNGNPKQIEALELLLNIKNKAKISLDQPFGIIFKEYKDNLTENGIVFKIILSIMRNADKIIFGTCALPLRVTQQLDEPPGFDHGDRIFVEVAYHTNSSIITEDTAPGDFDGRVCLILEKELGVTVFTIDTAHKLFSSS